MNGTERKIEIFTPFGEAFDLTKKILFQPFDLAKWFVIGLAAFLAGHFGGGFGFTFPPRLGDFRHYRPVPHFTPIHYDQFPRWLPVFIISFLVFVFVFTIVFLWLQSRGNFIFTDCIVRNRSAIVAPWREYRKEGNSYFLFRLVVMFAFMVLFLVIALILFSAGFFSNWHRHHVDPVGLVIVLVVFMACWMTLSLAINLVIYFMAPVMYRQRCRAMDAFHQVTRLVFDNAAPFILFCLFAIVLFLAMMAIAMVATCLTCCVAALPYIGTMILLPVFVCLRAFGLLFLRQFGPDYDVWATVPPPLHPPLPPPVQV